eukprot:3469257-Pyramimonas_sp.AAC.1
MSRESARSDVHHHHPSPHSASIFQVVVVVRFLLPTCEDLDVRRFDFSPDPALMLDSGPRGPLDGAPG